MAILLETPNRRLYPPHEVFGGHCRHACLAGCGNVMVVPDDNTPGAPNELREGQIWGCARCEAAHEYYMVYLPGARWACIRLLRGIQRRESAEPKVTEFLSLGMNGEAW